MPTKGLHIEIAPVAGDSKVYVDGIDISHLVRRVEIIADVKHRMTQVHLSCYHKDTREPFVIKGELLEADPGEVI